MPETDLTQLSEMITEEELRSITHTKESPKWLVYAYIAVINDSDEPENIDPYKRLVRLFDFLLEFPFFVTSAFVVISALSIKSLLLMLAIITASKFLWSWIFHAYIQINRRMLIPILETNVRDRAERIYSTQPAMKYVIVSIFLVVALSWILFFMVYVPIHFVFHQK